MICGSYDDFRRHRGGAVSGPDRTTFQPVLVMKRGNVLQLFGLVLLPGPAFYAHQSLSADWKEV
jgi:hypothetical protein